MVVVIITKLLLRLHSDLPLLDPSRSGPPAAPGEHSGGLQSKPECTSCFPPWLPLPQNSWDCWVSHPAQCRTHDNLCNSSFTWSNHLSHAQRRISQTCITMVTNSMVVDCVNIATLLLCTIRCSVLLNFYVAAMNSSETFWQPRSSSVTKQFHNSWRPTVHCCYVKA